MTDGSDGYYLIPLCIIGAAEFIDWDALVGALMGDQPATDFRINLMFKSRLDALGLPEREAYQIWGMWTRERHFNANVHNCTRPLCHWERMALARVCRRIIREAKEKESK